VTILDNLRAAVADEFLYCIVDAAFAFLHRTQGANTVVVNFFHVVEPILTLL